MTTICQGTVPGTISFAGSNPVMLGVVHDPDPEAIMAMEASPKSLRMASFILSGPMLGYCKFLVLGFVGFWMSWGPPPVATLAPYQGLHVAEAPGSQARRPAYLRIAVEKAE